MKAGIFTLAAASLVAAQDFSGQPECASSCLQQSIPQVGCGISDTNCQCQPETMTRLNEILQPCLRDNCSPEDLAASQNVGNALCADLPSPEDAANQPVTSQPVPSQPAEASPSPSIAPTSDAVSGEIDVSPTGSPELEGSSMDGLADNAEEGAGDAEAPVDDLEEGTDGLEENTDDVEETDDEYTSTDTDEEEDGTVDDMNSEETSAPTEDDEDDSVVQAGAGRGPTIGVLAAIFAAAMAL